MKPIGDESQKYKSSEFHFKSPHWKSRWAEVFNHISREVGDPRVLPGRVPWRRDEREAHNSLENLELSREIVEDMNKQQ